NRTKPAPRVVSDQRNFLRRAHCGPPVNASHTQTHIITPKPMLYARRKLGGMPIKPACPRYFGNTNTRARNPTGIKRSGFELCSHELRSRKRTMIRSTAVAHNPSWYSQKVGKIVGAMIATKMPPAAPPAESRR